MAERKLSIEKKSVLVMWLWLGCCAIYGNSRVLP
jgi:hypothetical protein